MLTVLGFAGKRFSGKYPKYYWNVRCDCGTVKAVGKHHLGKGTKSCGCMIGKTQKTGSDSPSWKGGRRIEDGYVLMYLPSHPRSKSNGYVREHTLVMEKKIGRYLLQDENVHHVNGVKHDNRPNNLELWSKSQPSGQRVEDKLRWAKEIIKLYDKI